MGDLEKIRKKLGHLDLKWTPSRYIDTGSPVLNSVIGHTEKGIPYGRLTEISGPPAVGKTALSLGIAAAAQEDGSQVIWMDLETSFDPEWAVLRSLDPKKVELITPYMGDFNGETRLASGEDLFLEAETIVKDRKRTDKSRSIIVVDSIPSIQLAAVAAIDPSDRNMRIKMELPMFLSFLVPRWVSMAFSYNVAILFINQLRDNPMAMKFAKKTYNPGGKAVPFFSHVRVELKRKKRLIQKGAEVGLEGEMRAEKNKAGGRQGAVIKYTLRSDTGKLDFK